MIIDQELLDNLFEKAKASDRLRVNPDLRTSAEDGSQRMLNAMMPETEVAIHRHPMSNENVILLTGRMYEVLYEEVSTFNIQASNDTKMMDAQDVSHKVTLKVRMVNMRRMAVKVGTFNIVTARGN